MTDNAAGTHSKVIGSSPSSSPSVWTHTVPGADTVARRACRIGDPRQAQARAAPSYATQMNGLADEQDLRLRFDVLTKTKQAIRGFVQAALVRLVLLASSSSARRTAAAGPARPPARSSASPSLGGTHLGLPGVTYLQARDAAMSAPSTCRSRPTASCSASCR